MWNASTADDELQLAVERALKKVLRHFALKLHMAHQGPELEPVPMPSGSRFGNVAFLARISKAVAMLLQPQRPLDDEVATGSM
eukprot:59507-Alexandrium_andersonii.AAC.1